MAPAPGAGGAGGDAARAPSRPRRRGGRSGTRRAADPRAARRRRGYWIPGLIAMAVLLAIGLAFGAGDLDHGTLNTLPGTEVSQDIAQAIQAQDGTHVPPQVHCPASEPVRAGLQFTCTVTQGQTSRTVRVVETNGRGELSLSLGS